MKQKLILALSLTVLTPTLVSAAEPMDIDPTFFSSQTDITKKRQRSSNGESEQPELKRLKAFEGSNKGQEKQARELVDASNYISLDTCGDFCGLARENLVGIISLSPISIRAVNKTFYFLSSGYTTPGAIGLETPPVAGCFGNPAWTAKIHFMNTILDSIPSPAWFVLAKEVINIPVSLVTKLKGSQVHTLNLSWNEIGDEETKDLNLQGTQVHALNLSWNQIGAEGAKGLNLQGIQVNILNLSHNQIGPEGAKGLSLQGTQVHTLVLSWNQIGDEGAKGLDLKDTQVHTLDLRYNQIGDEAQMFLRDKYPHITFIF